MLRTFLTVSFVAANLIKNGGFDDHADGQCQRSWCALRGDAATKAIFPWEPKFDGTMIEVDSSPSPWPAHSGKWSMDLAANYKYSIPNLNLHATRESRAFS